MSWVPTLHDTDGTIRVVTLEGKAGDEQDFQIVGVPHPTEAGQLECLGHFAGLAEGRMQVETPGRPTYVNVGFTHTNPQMGRRAYPDAVCHAIAETDVLYWCVMHRDQSKNLDYEIMRNRETTSERVILINGAATHDGIPMDRFMIYHSPNAQIIFDGQSDVVRCLQL